MILYELLPRRHKHCDGAGIIGRPASPLSIISRGLLTFFSKRSRRGERCAKICENSKMYFKDDITNSNSGHRSQDTGTLSVFSIQTDR